MDEDPKLLAPVTTVADAAQEGEAFLPESVEVGQWYWVNPTDKENRWFGCVVRIGTNYVKVEGPRGGSCRIHFDEFYDTCKYEPNPDAIINGKIAGLQRDVSALLDRVKEVTAQLAIGPSPLLGASETQALAVRGQDQPDMKAYGTALAKAKKETLPNLFEQIKNANESMAAWMTAKVVPLKAQAEGLDAIIGKINARIFSVELYAGLTEKVECIKEGEPAGLTERIRLFQRRSYMDEECLARYESGGMEFNDLRDFDKWLVHPDNLSRLLPFPRCVVAFRVRRNAKFRELVNFVDLQWIMDEEAADKFTYLYIRNGEQVFRMHTAIEFDAKLFPDLDRGQLTGKLWAREFAGTIKDLITDNEHTGILEARARSKKEWEEKNAAYQAALKSPEAKARAKAKGLDKPDASCVDVPWVHDWWHENYESYSPYDKGNVYFDDITSKIERKIQEHNRIALILQGLLDRSPVMHPHPPWQIWTAEGFEQALELIYDDSRVLVAGDKPDFEAYRSRLNASLKVGSVTIGQDAVWVGVETEKESDRRDSDYRHRNEHYRPKCFRPDGNPGPGTLAKLAEYSKSSGKCSYSWNRQRQTQDRWGEPIRTGFSCNRKHVLNVDAYRPGDFRQFFDDPRTRTEYLQWAPLLLEAEEYHAGNRKVLEPVPPEPKKESSWDGQRRYQHQKLRKFLFGKAVRLLREIKTKGGKTYEEGSLWRVRPTTEGGKFSLDGILSDGTPERTERNETVRYLRGICDYEFQVDPSIPDPPEENGG
jgi:hypothetical protein